MTCDPVLSTLGLALRAGALAVGEAPVTEAGKTRRAQLILLSANAAGNTEEKARRLARESGTPLTVLPQDKEAVGNALGRSVCAMMAVTDAGFAALILSKLAPEDPEGQAVRLREKARRAKKSAGPGRVKPSKHNRRWPV